MSEYQYDLIVIGGGSGGIALARRAASYGAKVALLEPRELGGTCVHRGCVPKKLLSYAAAFPYEFEVAAGFGYTVPNIDFSWPALIAAKDAELERLLGFYRSSVAGSGVEHIAARGRLNSAHEVDVEGQASLTARYVCVAVGGRSFQPQIPGFELGYTSDDVFRLPQLPRRWVVQGSGYIGVEFASILRGLGCQVELVFRSALPLPQFDGDLRRCLKEEMERRGVTFHTNTTIDGISRSDDGLVLSTSGGDLPCDAFLCAAGRVPNTADLGLEEVGVHCDDKGAIVINEQRETSVPGVFALGDCTGKVQLTPYAIAEGRALGDRVFGQKTPNPMPLHIPTAVFTLPPLATVGATEEDARSLWGEDVDIYRTRFRPMRYTLPKKEEKVLMKLVVRRSTQQVLGAHMLGAEGPEIIQALAVAITCGATKSQFDQTLAVHPTVAEEFVLLREPAPPPERN